METDSNYGEIFAFWDLLFGSFRKCGADPVEYGLEVCRETSAQRLDALLLLPANLGALQ
jgi:sterol desaturase/sphingolipid hydroxylase (fatty acid hydroxylase superfamily)